MDASILILCAIRHFTGVTVTFYWCFGRFTGFRDGQGEYAKRIVNNVELDQTVPLVCWSNFAQEEVAWNIQHSFVEIWSLKHISLLQRYDKQCEHSQALVLLVPSCYTPGIRSIYTKYIGGI